MKKQILICSNDICDFTKLFTEFYGISCTVTDFKELINHDCSMYDSFIIIGAAEPNSYNSVVFDKIQQIAANKKPAFIQVLPGICGATAESFVSSRFMRLIYTGYENAGIQIEKGDILDDQNNTFYEGTPVSSAIPILVYKDKVMAHNRFRGDLVYSSSDYALWKDNSILYCAFDISNFAIARFAPFAKWQSIINYLFFHLTGKNLTKKIPQDYSNAFHNSSKSINLTECFGNAVNWFSEASILVNDGKGGVYEGFATEINSAGIQKKAVEIRNDCCGETMFAFFIDFLLTKNSKSLTTSDNISDFIFLEMFTNQPGSILHGMMKWSLNAENICYADDVARAVIPQMLKCRYSGNTTYLDKCSTALEFLCSTTGTDGLRINRTDNKTLNEAKILELASSPSNNPSAHYTGYYSGALLLNYTITGNKKFRDIGVRGLESIMAAYPDTKRCQSETQELCRLILPLALLYEATLKDEHKTMLYRVSEDLKKHRHDSGAYLEWDTGYQSRYSRTTGDECSILTKNGDPVADFLYSLNWLPFGFIQAYFITKDVHFLDLWESISSFMMKSQIVSNNLDINGAWARGWDVEINEIYALPNDVGWGPWCIESGWTVAEIASGIGMGLLKDRLIKYYLNPSD